MYSNPQAFIGQLRVNINQMYGLAMRNQAFRAVMFPLIGLLVMLLCGLMLHNTSRYEASIALLGFVCIAGFYLNIMCRDVQLFALSSQAVKIVSLISFALSAVTSNALCEGAMIVGVLSGLLIRVDVQVLYSQAYGQLRLLAVAALGMVASIIFMLEEKYIWRKMAVWTAKGMSILLLPAIPTRIMKLKAVAPALVHAPTQRAIYLWRQAHHGAFWKHPHPAGIFHIQYRVFKHVGPAQPLKQVVAPHKFSNVSLVSDHFRMNFSHSANILNGEFLVLFLLTLLIMTNMSRFRSRHITMLYLDAVCFTFFVNMLILTVIFLFGHWANSMPVGKISFLVKQLISLMTWRSTGFIGYIMAFVLFALIINRNSLSDRVRGYWRRKFIA